MDMLLREKRRTWSEMLSAQDVSTTQLSKSAAVRKHFGPTTPLNSIDVWHPAGTSNSSQIGSRTNLDRKTRESVRGAGISFAGKENSQGRAPGSC